MRTYLESVQSYSPSSVRGFSGVPAPKPAPKKHRKPTDGQPEDGSADSQGQVQDDYQEVAKEVHDDARRAAEEGTPVGSPGSNKKKAIGPLGDTANVVGKMSRKKLMMAGLGGGILVFAQGIGKQLAALVAPNRR